DDILKSQEAARLEPPNELLQMKLAVVRLHSGDAKVVAEANRTLEAMRTNAVYRVPILRSLVNFNLEHANTSKATALSRELQAEPGTEFADRILHSAVLRQ